MMQYTAEAEDENIASYPNIYVCKTCVDERAIVWSNESSPDNILGSGTHSLPFQFTLPPNCPPSYSEACSAILGQLYYYVQGYVKNDKGKPCKTTDKTSITVMNLVDINEPEFQIAIHETKQKKVGCFCCFSGEIETTVFLPCKGFCVGHNILLTIKVDNDSSRSAFLMIKVIQAVQLGNCYYEYDILSATSPRIEPHSNYIWTPDNLTIPPLTATTFRSEVMSLSYCLRVTTVICCAKKSTINVPITVGNVPPSYQSEPIYLNL